MTIPRMYDITEFPVIHNCPPPPNARSLRFVMMLHIAVVAGMLAGCAGQQYAGVNYGEVTTPSGEHWIIAGGKDETNVSFEVTRPDGTRATYHADNADSSTVIKAMTEQYSRLMTQSLQMIQALMPTPVPAP